MGTAILSDLLVGILKGIAEYKNTRDEMLRKGEVTHADSSVISNKDLIALFRGEAQSLVTNADDLIAKYAGQPRPPVPPTE